MAARAHQLRRRAAAAIDSTQRRRRFSSHTVTVRANVLTQYAPSLGPTHPIYTSARCTAAVRNVVLPDRKNFHRTWPTRKCSSTWPSMASRPAGSSSKWVLENKTKTHRGPLRTGKISINGSLFVLGSCLDPTIFFRLLPQILTSSITLRVPWHHPVQRSESLFRCKHIVLSNYILSLARRSKFKRREASAWPDRRRHGRLLCGSSNRQKMFFLQRIGWRRAMRQT